MFWRCLSSHLASRISRLERPATSAQRWRVWHEDSTQGRVTLSTTRSGAPMPAALLLAAVCACAGDDPRAAINAARDTAGAAIDCGVPEAGVQIERGIGVLQVGATVELLGERCRLVKDSVVTGVEGMPGRQLYIVIPGRHGGGRSRSGYRLARPPYDGTVSYRRLAGCRHAGGGPDEP